MLGAIPASVGVAVLRYRLYDIDRVINRTLVYGVLTCSPRAAYGAIRCSARRSAAAPLGDGRRDAVVAVAFRPLRGAVQDVVDRRFSRARYDARSRIAASSRTCALAGRARGDRAVLREVLADPRSSCASSCPRPSSTWTRAATRSTTRPEDRRLRDPGRPRRVPLGMVLHGPVARRTGPDCWTRSSRLPGSRSRSPACASSCGASSTRSRPRGRGSLRRATPSAAGSSATCTTAPQQRLVSIGLALRHAQHELGPRRTGRRVDRAGGVGDRASRSRSCAELARGCGRRSSTRAWRPRSTSSPAARRSRSRSRSGGGALPARRSRPRRTSSPAKA